MSRFQVRLVRLSAEMQATLATVAGKTDREKLETLLAVYAKHHPATDDRFAILGWQSVKLATVQTCYECEKPVTGDAYQVVGREWFAHVGCIDND